MSYINTPLCIQNIFKNYFASKQIEISIHQIICREDDMGEEPYKLLSPKTRDYDTPIFDDSYLCIDLDSLECARRERRKGKKQNNPSMDIAFFIEDNENIFTVLAEFRLNYKIVSNIKKDELDGKVTYSTHCSRHFFKLPIYQKQYFVFPHETCSQFRHRLGRMNPKCSPNYIAIDVSTLYSEFFDKQPKKF